jgi:hypothetical protein
MRLAWWRDRLRDSSANWPKGEPLLTALKCWQDGHGALIALVDGWEALLGDAPLPVDAFETWIHGRVTACAALGKGGEEMARGWALSDLASHIGDAQEQLLLAELVEAHRWKGARLSRAMRPLVVLHGLAARTKGACRARKTFHFSPFCDLASSVSKVLSTINRRGDEQDCDWCSVGADLGRGWFFWWQGRANLEHAAPLPLAAEPQADNTIALPEADPHGRGAALPNAVKKEVSKEDRRFNRYDRNRDGTINRNEMLSTRVKAFQKLDLNHDNLLSFEEWAVKTSNRFRNRLERRWHPQPRGIERLLRRAGCPKS